MSKPSFSALLLAGGTGCRMNSAKPKQFLPLGPKPIAHYSLDVLLGMPETAEIVVVCEPELRYHFDGYHGLKWALPGPRRQDSVFNGLQQVDPHAHFVCVHDACRPFIDENLVRRVFAAACEYGASAAGMPVRYTVKEINAAGLVVSTPDRSLFWEIQTPQILQAPLLRQGFQKAHAKNLSVTDDTSLAELVGAPVKLVEGAYANIKITTPDDLAMAETLLKAYE